MSSDQLHPKRIAAEAPPSGGNSLSQSLGAAWRLLNSPTLGQPLPERWWIPPLAALAMILAFTLASLVAGEEFPVDVGRDVGATLDDGVDWLTENLSWFLQAIKDTLIWFLIALADALLWMPWPASIVGVSLLSLLLVSWRMALFSAGAFILLATMGLWESTMETLSLIIVTVDALDRFRAAARGLGLAERSARCPVAAGPGRDANTAQLRLPGAGDRLLQCGRRAGRDRRIGLRRAAGGPPDQSRDSPSAGRNDRSRRIVRRDALADAAAGEDPP